MKKFCTRCKKHKSYNLFYKNCLTSDGFQNICKKCDLIKQRDYRKRNIYKVRKYAREFRREWKIKNKEHWEKYIKKYKEKNKDIE